MPSFPLAAKMGVAVLIVAGGTVAVLAASSADDEAPRPDTSTEAAKPSGKKAPKAYEPRTSPTRANETRSSTSGGENGAATDEPSQTGGGSGGAGRPRSKLRSGPLRRGRSGGADTEEEAQEQVRRSRPPIIEATP